MSDDNDLGKLRADRARLRSIAASFPCKDEIHAILDAFDRLDAQGLTWVRLELGIDVGNGAEVHFHACADCDCDCEPVTVQYRTEPVTEATVRRLCSGLIALDVPLPEAPADGPRQRLAKFKERFSGNDGET